MVTTLTVTMILGFTTIVVLFVIRFREFTSPAVMQLPESISLPGDASAIAFTQAEAWYAVVTDEDVILIFDRSDGSLIRRIEVFE